MPYRKGVSRNAWKETPSQRRRSTPALPSEPPPPDQATERDAPAGLHAGGWHGSGPRMQINLVPIRFPDFTGPRYRQYQKLKGQSSSSVSSRIPYSVHRLGNVNIG